jgi:hypothetical protein
MTESAGPLREDPDKPPGSERRESTRYLCDLELSFFVTAALEGDPYLARVRNISAGGMSMVASRPFDPGTLLVVVLENPHRNFSRPVQFRVIYCLEHPNGDWILGGSFAHKLSKEDLVALL